MISAISSFILPVVIGIILFSYLEGKLHLSIPRSLGVGRMIGLGVLKPIVGVLRQLVRMTISGISIKKGQGDFKTREHNPPRW
jgi:hypothetical protein